jgi:hypothetical protein
MSQSTTIDRALSAVIPSYAAQGHDNDFDVALRSAATRLKEVAGDLSPACVYAALAVAQFSCMAEHDPALAAALKELPGHDECSLAADIFIGNDYAPDAAKSIWDSMKMAGFRQALSIPPAIEPAPIKIGVSAEHGVVFKVAQPAC